MTTSFILSFLGHTGYTSGKVAPRKVVLPYPVEVSDRLFGLYTITQHRCVHLTPDTVELLINASTGPLPENIDYDIFASRAAQLKKEKKVYRWHPDWDAAKPFETMFKGINGLHGQRVFMSRTEAASFLLTHQAETRKAFMARGIKFGEQVYLTTAHPGTGFQHEFIVTSTRLGISVVQCFVDGAGKAHYSEYCDGYLPESNLCCFEGLQPDEALEERILNIVGGASGEPNLHERIEILMETIQVS